MTLKQCNYFFQAKIIFAIYFAIAFFILNPELYFKTINSGIGLCNNGRKAYQFCIIGIHYGKLLVFKNIIGINHYPAMDMIAMNIKLVLIENGFKNIKITSVLAPA